MTRRILGVGLIGAAAVLVLLACAWPQRVLLHGLSVDDAYITFRYASHWAHGLGPVYNAGERVEGYSNFLWLCLLTAYARLGGQDFDVLAQLLGAIASAASVLLAPWTLWRVHGVDDWPWLLGSALLVASSGYVAAWAVGGLEGPLYGLMLLGVCAAFALEHSPAPGALASPAPWTTGLCIVVGLSRPEGQLIASGIVVAHLLARYRAGDRTPSLRMLGLPLGVVVALGTYQAFRVSYYGPHLWPNSVRAKVGMTPEQLSRGLAFVLQNVMNPYAVLIAAGLLLLWRERRLSTVLAVGIPIGSLGIVAVAGGDWSPGRLTAPLVPLLAVTGVAGLASLLGQYGAQRAGRLAAWLGLGLYVAHAAAVTGTRELDFRTLYAPVDLQRVRIGRWLAEHAPPNTVLAVTGAGQIPFYSGLYTHDLFGLNDAHIAALPPPPTHQGLAGHEKYDVHYSVDVVRPHVIQGAQYVPGMLDHLGRTGRYALVPLRSENLLVAKGYFSREALRELVSGP